MADNPVLRDLLRSANISALAERTGLRRNTIARVRDGLPVRPGTLDVLKRGLGLNVRSPYIPPPYPIEWAGGEAGARLRAQYRQQRITVSVGAIVDGEYAAVAQWGSVTASARHGDEREARRQAVFALALLIDHDLDQHLGGNGELMAAFNTLRYRYAAGRTNEETASYLLARTSALHVEQFVAAVEELLPALRYALEQRSWAALKASIPMRDGISAEDAEMFAEEWGEE